MANPLDEKLVEAVLASGRAAPSATLEEAKLATCGRAGRRGKAAPAPDADDADDADDDDDDLATRTSSSRTRTPTGTAELSVEVMTEEAVEGVPVPADMDAPGEADRGRGRGADRRGARGALRRHDRDRRPGPDVPQGDRQGRPADRRGGGRPGQGDRARRADRRGALEGDRLAPRVDAPRHRAQDPDDQAAAPAAVRARGARDGGRRASRAEGAADLLVPTPDFHLVKAGKDAQSEGTKELLKEAKALVAALQRGARRRRRS